MTRFWTKRSLLNLLVVALVSIHSGPGDANVLTGLMSASAHALSAQKKGNATSRSRRRWCNRSASAAYKRMKRNWQKVPKGPAIKWRDGYRNLVLYSVNSGKLVDVFPFLSDGQLDPDALRDIEIAMADKDTGATHPVSPRLVKLLYKLAVRFKAIRFNVISGFREPGTVYGTESHHKDGTAIDFMIPGVPLPALAKVARRLGYVGVGYYPVGGYIHLDVRERRSYFWVDPSGPGKRSCHRPIMTTHVFRFDARYTPENDEPDQQKNGDGRPRGVIAESASPAEAPSS